MTFSFHLHGKVKRLEMDESRKVKDNVQMSMAKIKEYPKFSTLNNNLK